MLVNLALMLGTFFGMEAMAWLTHKYVMHGFMWRWHESHHRPRKGWWEVNDWFALVFGLLSTVVIIVGNRVEGLRFLFWLGLGIALYGVFYTIFHDVIVHRRVKVRFKARHPYLQRIIRAHHVHHRVHTKEGAEAFGFLYSPRKHATPEKK